MGRGLEQSVRFGGAGGKVRSWRDPGESCGEPQSSGGHSLCRKAGGDGLL